MDDTTEVDEFSAKVMSAYSYHWNRSDVEQRVAIMYSLCLAVAASIAHLADGDRQAADKAVMISEAHIKIAVDDFMSLQRKKRAH
jgi:hypothetical protein